MPKPLSEKIKLIRNYLSMSQSKFGELVGISRGVIKKYDEGTSEIGSTNLQKVVNSPECFKFTLWLLTGKTASAVGQVSPTGEGSDVVRQEKAMNMIAHIERLAALNKDGMLTDLEYSDFKEKLLSL